MSTAAKPLESDEFHPEEILKRLTNEEKLALLAGGTGFWFTTGLPKHGIPVLHFSDSPNGIRGSKTFDPTPTNVFPCNTALASTWNYDLIYELGSRLGAEAKAKGASVVLGPMCNIVRSYLAGRGYNDWSEDPFLAGNLSEAHVKGVQSTGIASCLKHFVCNDMEGGRKRVSSEVTPRPLREVYLRPFEIATKNAKPLTYMTGYNKMNGVHCSEDPWLLQKVLREEWGWDGLVMSDWLGTYSSSESLNAGLDLEMPGASKFRSLGLERDLIAGKVRMDTIDKSVLRFLKLVKHALNNGISHGFDPVPEGTIDTDETREILRRSCAESIVLLKNERKVLPLNKSIKKIAVIGQHAGTAFYCGGEPGLPRPVRAITPLEGIQAAAGDNVEITYHVGAHGHRLLPLLGQSLRARSSQAGFDLELYNKDPFTSYVAPASVKHYQETTVFLGWTKLPDTIETPWMQAVATFTPDQGGPWEFGLVVISRGKLYLDDVLVIDNWTTQERGEEFFGHGTVEKRGKIHLQAGKTYTVRLQIDSNAGNTDFRGMGGFRLGGIRDADPKEAREEAVKAAMDADVAIVMVGLSHEYESEGFDRKHFKLAKGYDDLIQAVAASKPETIVVTQGGTPFEMPWVEDVSTLLHYWYPGNEGGHALADVLFGQTNPSGKLSVTFPKRIEDVPSHLNWPGENDKIHYGEGLFVGYRYFDTMSIPVNFCFGYGLSYSEFAFADLRVDVNEELQIKVTLAVTNSGSVAGSEIVQVYISDPVSRLIRPKKQLEGFGKTHLEPGETKRVSVSLNRTNLQYWDDSLDKWVIEAGEFIVLAAKSVNEVVLEASFTVDTTRVYGP